MEDLATKIKDMIESGDVGMNSLAEMFPSYASYFEGISSGSIDFHEGNYLSFPIVDSKGNEFAEVGYLPSDSVTLYSSGRQDVITFLHGYLDFQGSPSGVWFSIGANQRIVLKDGHDLSLNVKRPAVYIREKFPRD